MRVCVLRLDALGDTLLSTPAIRNLVDAGHDVRVFTSAAGTVVLTGLARAVEVSGPEDLAERVRETHPDVVIGFSEKRRSLLAARSSGAGIRVGFDPGWVQPMKTLAARLVFTHRFRSTNDPRRDSGLHEVERYCRLLGTLDSTLDSPGPLYFPRVDHLSQRQWLVDRELTQSPVALQLTPKWMQDGWSVAWLRDLCQRLPGPVVALFGPAEADWVRQNFEGLGLALAPVGTVLEYGALLGLCRGLVTVDTGAAHVAAALGVPVVDVFPERNAAHCVGRWRPWQVEHRVVIKPEHTVGREVELTRAIQLAVHELFEEPKPLV
jgi:ADP-heptose:LPS heptosyltransferase